MFFVPPNLTTASRITFKALQLGIWALSAAFIFSNPAKAQLGASPLVIESQANRGQAQAFINVTNSGDISLRVRLYTEPFTYNRDKGFQTAPSSANDLSSYLQFSPRELTVPPGVTRRVRLRAMLAPSLPDGEYRTAVFTESLKELRDDDSNTVSVVTRVGTVIYVRKGDVEPNLAVDSVSFDQAKNQIKLLIRNTGEASAISTANWTLKQGETVISTGESIATTVIAQGDRNFLLSDAKLESLSPGNYQLTGELTWGEDESNKLPFSVNLTVPEQ